MAQKAVRSHQHENVASGGDAAGLRCAREYTPNWEPSGSEFDQPSAEAVQDALLIYFGGELAGVGHPNPWPDAQVDRLVADGWVDRSFIQPWLDDARMLANYSREALARVCPGSGTQ